MSESENDGDAALREALASPASGPREQSSCGWSAMRDLELPTVYVVTLHHHYEYAELIDVGASMEIGMALATAHYVKFSGFTLEDHPLKWSENKIRKGVMTTCEEWRSSSYEVEAKTIKSKVE